MIAIAASSRGIAAAASSSIVPQQPPMPIYSFRVDAPRFAPRAGSLVKMASDNHKIHTDDQQRVAELEARLASLDGPENAQKRRRVRNQLKKLRDPFAEAKAALPTAELPQQPSRPPAPARGAPRKLSGIAR